MLAAVESNSLPSSIEKLARARLSTNVVGRPMRSIPYIKERILDLSEKHDQGAKAIAHMLRSQSDITITNNRVHEILTERDRVSENPKEQGRKRRGSTSSVSSRW